MITLSLCMIVKNEEKLLGRCLSCISPAVDEIIIADTGSTDATKEIAAKFHSKIFDFPWCDDFSAARNFSFSKASMDYCLWLDADDVINKENVQKLMRLKQTLNPDTDIAMFLYAAGFSSDQNPPGQDASFHEPLLQNPSIVYYRERLIKNHSGFVWEGPVHECITPSGNIFYSDIVIEHRPENTHNHTERNLRIYEKYFNENGIPNTRSRFYYARELQAALRYDEAIAHFISVIYDSCGWIENRIEACKNLSSCFLAAGKTDEALEALFKSFSFALPRAEILCAIGDIFKEKREYLTAIYWYELALTCPSKPQNGGFCQPDSSGYYPCMQLCFCYYEIGDFKQAYDYHIMAGKWNNSTKEWKYNDQFFKNAVY